MSKILNLLKNKIFIIITIILLIIITTGAIITINYKNQFDTEAKKVAEKVYLEKWFDTESILSKYKITNYPVLTKFDLYEPIYTIVEVAEPYDEKEKQEFPVTYYGTVIKLKRDSLSDFNFYKKEKTYQQTINRFMKLEDILDFVSKTNIRDNNPDQSKWGSGVEEPTQQQLEERKRSEIANKAGDQEEERLKNRTPAEIVTEETERLDLLTSIYQRCLNGETGFTFESKIPKGTIPVTEDDCKAVIKQYKETQQRLTSLIEENKALIK